MVSDCADRSRGVKLVTNLGGRDARIGELRGCIGAGNETMLRRFSFEVW